MIEPLKDLSSLPPTGLTSDGSRISVRIRRCSQTGTQNSPQTCEAKRLPTSVTVAWEKSRPLSDLLNYQATFATPRLARHYKLPESNNKVDDAGTTLYDLSQVKGRGGLLTHASVLTVGGDEASMVSRGLFVLHDLMRGIVRDPPPCVDTTRFRPKPDSRSGPLRKHELLTNPAGAVMFVLNRWRTDWKSSTASESFMKKTSTATNSAKMVRS